MPRKVSKFISALLCLCFFLQQTGLAQVAAELNIAGYMSSLRQALVQDKFRPLHLRYFSYNLKDNNFNILLDKGDAKDLKPSLVEDASKLVMKYFLVGVTLPNETFWVNLRPDSPQDMIDDYLAQTDVGKVMLETDLQLKKDAASFTSPQTPEGREYWNKLYQKAEELYGSGNITIPTLTRPWIVPDEIIIRETADSAYIYKATLKVMLEQDYLKNDVVYNFKDEKQKQLNDYSSQLIRELIIPKLTREVNTSKRYASLRQVYYSLTMAQWFKSRFLGRGGIYASLIDQRNLTGLTSTVSWSKTEYFRAYQKSFKDGEYNINEPVQTPFGQTIRSYFSGGAILSEAMPAPGETRVDPQTGANIGSVIGSPQLSPGLPDKNIPVSGQASVGSPVSDVRAGAMPEEIEPVARSIPLVSLPTTPATSAAKTPEEKALIPLAWKIHLATQAGAKGPNMEDGADITKAGSFEQLPPRIQKDNLSAARKCQEILAGLKVDIEKVRDALSETLKRLKDGWKLDDAYGTTEARQAVLDAGIQLHELWLARQQREGQAVEADSRGDFFALSAQQQLLDLAVFEAAVSTRRASWLSELTSSKRRSDKEYARDRVQIIMNGKNLAARINALRELNSRLLAAFLEYQDTQSIVDRLAPELEKLIIGYSVSHGQELPTEAEARGEELRKRQEENSFIGEALTALSSCAHNGGSLAAQALSGVFLNESVDSVYRAEAFRKLNQAADNGNKAAQREVQIDIPALEGPVLNGDLQLLSELSELAGRGNRQALDIMVRVAISSDKEELRQAIVSKLKTNQSLGNDDGRMLAREALARIDSGQAQEPSLKAARVAPQDPRIAALNEQFKRKGVTVQTMRSRSSAGQQRLSDEQVSQVLAESDRIMKILLLKKEDALIAFLRNLGYSNMADIKDVQIEYRASGDNKDTLKVTVRTKDNREASFKFALKGNISSGSSLFMRGEYEARVKTNGTPYVPALGGVFSIGEDGSVYEKGEAIPEGKKYTTVVIEEFIEGPVVRDLVTSRGQLPLAIQRQALLALAGFVLHLNDFKIDGRVQGPVDAHEENIMIDDNSPQRRGVLVDPGAVVYFNDIFEVLTNFIISYSYCDRSGRALDILQETWPQIDWKAIFLQFRERLIKERLQIQKEKAAPDASRAPELSDEFVRENNNQRLLETVNNFLRISGPVISEPEAPAKTATLEDSLMQKISAQKRIADMRAAVAEAVRSSRELVSENSPDLLGLFSLLADGYSELADIHLITEASKDDSGILEAVEPSASSIPENRRVEYLRYILEDKVFKNYAAERALIKAIRERAKGVSGAPDAVGQLVLHGQSQPLEQLIGPSLNVIGRIAEIAARADTESAERSLALYSLKIILEKKLSSEALSCVAWLFEAAESDIRFGDYNADESYFEYLKYVAAGRVFDNIISGKISPSLDRAAITSLLRSSIATTLEQYQFLSRHTDLVGVQMLNERGQRVILAQRVADGTVVSGEEGEAVGSSKEAQIRQRATRALGREPTDEEFAAIWKAHLTEAPGEQGELGEADEDGIYRNSTYSQETRFRKTRALMSATKAGTSERLFTNEQVQRLGDFGAMGTERRQAAREEHRFVSDAKKVWQLWSNGRGLSAMPGRQVVAEGSQEELFAAVDNVWKLVRPGKNQGVIADVIGLLLENVRQHAGDYGVLFVKFDEANSKVYVAVMDRAQNNIYGQYRDGQFVQRDDSPGKGIALNEKIQKPQVEKLRFYTSEGIIFAVGDKDTQGEEGFEGIEGKGTLAFAVINIAAEGPVEISGGEPVAGFEDKLRQIDEVYQKLLDEEFGEGGAFYSYMDATGGGNFAPADIRTAAEALRRSGLSPGKKFVDLGTGDMRVPVIAAVLFGAKAVGVEKNPTVISIAKEALKRLERSGIIRPGQVELVEGNIFDYPVNDADVVFYYEGSGSGTASVERKLLKELSRPGAQVVLYGYLGEDMGFLGLEPQLDYQGRNSVRIYRVPGQAPGGIDFRSLPITTQPLINAPGLGFSSQKIIPNASLDKEWGDIENMLNKGIIPSIERIREYLFASCSSQDCQARAEQALNCIADILRMEEDTCSPTEGALKQLLVLIESNKPAKELKTCLLNLQVTPKELESFGR